MLGDRTQGCLPVSFGESRFLLHCVTVFVQLLSLICGSEPYLLALRCNSEVETCEEGEKKKKITKSNSGPIRYPLAKSLNACWLIDQVMDCLDCIGSAVDAA